MTTRVLHQRLVALLFVLSMVVAGMLGTTPSHATPPPDFQKSLIVGDGLDGPSGFEIAPDGRIFILERGGLIKIVRDGQLLTQPFANLPSEATGDRGLIGIAFDPDFGVTNHYVYFYYTGHDLLNHLVRFSAVGDVGSDGPFELFVTQSPSQWLHVGGSIRFGPDGKLYFAVGDNGFGENAQNLDNPHGKILRINKDGSIPPDNPFAYQPGKLGAIWAYGFRNPWRFQFDPATGQMYGGDVGDFTWEEVNHIVRGGNYGWPIHEGVCTGNCSGYIDPIYAYNHNGLSAAVTGGPVYRSSMFPAEYQGNLFFGDYAQEVIRRAELDASGNVIAVHEFDNQAGSVVDMKVAPDGSLYYITYFPGELYRVSFNTDSHLPVAAASASVTGGIEPLTINFSSAGSFDPDGDPLSFLWTFGDGSSSTAANPTKTYTQQGVYTVRLTVTANGDSSIAQPIVIQVGIPPTLTVATPTEGQLYRAGDTITYTASAVDGAGRDINDAAIQTVVRLHHGTHYHPFVGPLTGRTGSFTIPTTGESSADTSYELTVTATDSIGLFTSNIVTIRPRTANLTLATSPPGLGLYLDSIPISTPHTVLGVPGFQRELIAPDTAVAADGTPLRFAEWSDGQAIQHTIVTPDTDTTYTANYVPDVPYTAEYFANPDLIGPPVLTRQEPQINYDWENGSPAPEIPVDNFSARWTKTTQLTAGTYQFTTTTDDGVRLYVDGTPIINQWVDQPPTTHTATIGLTDGPHQIIVEYFEAGGGAVASASYTRTSDTPPPPPPPPPPPGDAYTAEYFANPDLIGPPVLTRQDQTINFDWENGSPAPEIPVDNFSARWTKTTQLTAGTYQFTTTTDDGVRLYVDGTPIINQWVDQPPTTHTATIGLTDGPHQIIVEYFEAGGGAVARLTYGPPTG